jgi:Arc/MetJ family transcription regulator
MEGQGMDSRKVNVEIDEDLLVAAQRALATTTIKDTIEAAFREVLQGKARRDEVEALSTMRGLDLTDDEIMARAWRT